jgi:hypothetical protein
MFMGKGIWILAFFAALMLLVLLGVAILGGNRLLQLFFGPVERGEIDFESLERTGKPNDFLICPPGYCPVPVDEESPAFSLSAKRLAEEWVDLIESEPRTTLLSRNDQLQVEFEQQSVLFGFPDTITALFIPMGENKSTLAVYSRSHYGYSDLGVNQKRVRAWLRRLDDRARRTR